MHELTAKLDEMGRPAWIAVMVLGFIVFWPAGLMILAYLIWSGRMACGRYGNWHDGSSRWERKMQKFEDKMQRWQQRSGNWRRAAMAGFQPSGNSAFDDYRETTMRRLEEEFDEFKAFLNRLRDAKDKSEFEAFMNDRRNRPAGDASSNGAPPQAPTTSSDPWPKV